MENNKVMVVGLGYVGLPTAAVIADHGFEVIGYDVNKFAVETINSGRAHIVEEGLDELIKKLVKSKRLVATSEPEEADIFIITVPTPITSEKKSDLTYVESAFKSILEFLKKGDLIILESTSPVGTTQMMCELISSSRPDLKAPSLDSTDSDINIAYSPERILPGKTIEELVSNSRVVGGISKSCSEKAHSFYNNYVKGKIFTTNSATAEMCKLSENAYRDVNLAFANELSVLCDNSGIDVNKLIQYSNFHPRVDILAPGCGVGGHCIPVDPWFIIESNPNTTPLIHAARKVNDSKPNWVVDKIKSAIYAYQVEHNKIPNVALLGLTYKPNIDDVRESPALSIAKKLCTEYKENILLVDPFIDSNKFQDIGNFENYENLDKRADLIVKLVKHDLFSEINSLNLPSLDFS